MLAFVAVLVFGPDKLPELAKQAGTLIKSVRKMANNARDELRSELGPEYADLELRDLDPRTIVKRHIAEVLEEDDDEPVKPSRRGQRPLGDGEVPPYDAEAT